MKLLVVSIFYNRQDSIDESLNSLIKSLKGNYKLVLIDDGSTDNTLSRLKEFASESISVLEQKNKGFTRTLSETLSELIPQYDPEYLSIFGSGDIVSESKFEKQLSYMDKNTEVAATGVCCRTISAENGQVIKEEKGFVETDFNYLLNTMPFTHGSVVYRTAMFTKAGGYDATYEYCQDWDLFFRLLKQGRIVRLPDIVYSRFAFEDGASVNPTKRLKQLRFQKLLKSRAISEEYYQQLLEKTRKDGINETFDNNEMLPMFKNLVKSSFFKGEFQLAKKWILIVDELEQKNHSYLKLLLNILIKLKFPSILMSKLFTVLYALKK